ncbi:MAG: peptidylprolyl isomerase [Pseudomonadota bacterium]
MILSSRHLIFIAALGLSGGAFAQSAAPSLSTVVATVNGVEINMGHVLNAREDLPAQYADLPNDVMLQALMDQLVRQELISQSFGEMPAWAQAAVENEARNLRTGMAIDVLIRDSISDADLKERYEAEFGIDPTALEYNASHILVETEEEAVEIIEELNGGADFAALAQDRSTGPSGAQGGSLGWFGKGMMVPPFEAAVVALEAGALGQDPVQTQFGWHVIQLNETRAAGQPAFEDVRPQLEQQLRSEILAAHIDALLSGAEVTVVEDLAPSILDEVRLIEPLDGAASE